MIHIGKAKLFRSSDDVSKITVPISINNEKQTLWYSFPSKYEEYISIEVCDAYVVALLLYALENSLDIECELPISERLLFNLRKELIPFFCNFFSDYHMIQIKAKSFVDEFHGKHVGTGLSCGIDSLSTIIYHGLNEDIKNFKIDTLTLLNTGYYTSSNSDSLKNAVLRSKKFAERFGFDFLFVDTNITTITNYVFVKAHTYLTNSTILLFQKYFSNYFYASGYPISSFKLNKEYCAYYDLFTLNNISTQSLIFHSGCCTFTRVEKTNLILKYKDLFDFLFVCNGGGEGVNNCSECEKCIRTMLALESLGARERISDRFNVATYNKNRIKYISYALRKKKKNIYYNEIIKSFRENGIRIPFRAYFCLIPCQFEINMFKTNLVRTKIGKKIYKILKNSF